MTKSLSRTCIWLLLVLPPLLVGANRPIFWALNGLLAAFALTVFAWREYQAPLISRDRLFWAAAALLGLGAVWMALQSVSFTPQNWHHPLWQLLPEASSTISLAPAAGWAALGWWMTLAIFFPAMRAGAESPAFARAALLCIAVTGAVIAAFGMLVEHLDLPIIGLLPKQAYIGWVTGTFVSRNAAAAYFVVGLITCISIIAAPGHKGLFRLSGRARAYAAICAIFILPALLLTGSRAGILSGLVGLCLLAVMRLRQTSLGGISHIVVAAISVMAVSLVGSALLMRADDSISSNISRYGIYQESIAAISDRLWLGHGAGTFQAVQPLYQQPETSSDYVWQNAHSLYLESAVTLGLPMAAILIAGFTAIWIALFRRNRSGAGVSTTAALAAGLAVALHATVDFALQTQAVALTIAILSGLGAGESVARGDTRDRI